MHRKCLAYEWLVPATDTESWTHADDVLAVPGVAGVGGIVVGVLVEVVHRSLLRFILRVYPPRYAPSRVIFQAKIAPGNLHADNYSHQPLNGYILDYGRLTLTK